MNGGAPEASPKALAGAVRWASLSEHHTKLSGNTPVPSGGRAQILQQDVIGAANFVELRPIECNPRFPVKQSDGAAGGGGDLLNGTVAHHEPAGRGSCTFPIRQRPSDASGAGGRTWVNWHAEGCPLIGTTQISCSALLNDSSLRVFSKLGASSL